MRLFNWKSVVALVCCTLAFFAFTALPVCQAQDVSGMTGTVTDQSGAAIPGVTVTLTYNATGAKYTQITNSIGFYRFAQIPPGQGYSARFAAKGFATVTVNNISLLVAQVRTQNATMNVGTQVSTVEVTASNAVVTIDTTTATVGNDIDVQSLNNLPVQQRSDPTALFIVQPGVTVSGSVTGARQDQNYVTVDGLDVNDFVTGNASQTNSGVSTGFTGGIVGNAPVDSVEEFHAGVAGNEANIGAAGGGQFQLVTKSGTNHFHGDVNEYHRDPSLVANSWFSNHSNPIIPRNHLIQNQFGGSIGGPILRNKAYFFFDYNQNHVISDIVTQRTVPLDSMRDGNIKYYCDTTQETCPSSGIETLTPAQIQALDPAGIGEDTTFIGPNVATPPKLSTWPTGGFNARFPHSNNSVSGDGINSGGFNFNAPDNLIDTTWISRIDYHMTPSMNLWGRFTINRENAVEFPNEFAGDPATNPFVDRSYAAVIGHDWVIGNNKTNRVFLGETVQKVSFPNNYNPQGPVSFTFGDGADVSMASNLFLIPAVSARRVPIEMIGDDFSWTRGGHTWQMGGTFKNIVPHTTNVGDYNTSEIGLGGEVFGLCGPDPGACGGDNPSLRPADINASDALLYDEAFAFMLGRVGNVISQYNYNAQGTALPQLTGDQRFYKNYQTQIYVQDTWKAIPSLTLSYGVTYQFFSVPYETRGLESVEPMSFNQYFQARVAQSALGETGPGAVPILTYYLGGKANGSGAPPLYQPEYRLFAPHLGFSWNPSFDRKMVINGGGSVVYDRTVIAAVQAIQDVDSYLFQQQKTTQLGITGDPYDSIRTDPRLDDKNGLGNVPAADLQPPPTPKAPYQPFNTADYCAAQGYPTPCGLLNGYDFNATIDPALKTPYNILFNFGVQREMPWNMVLKASYVGRLGRRLLAQPDAQQVIDFPDVKSGQMLSQAFANITQEIRKNPDYTQLTTQPWFEDVMTPGLGEYYGFANNTQFVGGIVGNLVYNGDLADFNQFLSYFTPPNVGMAAQFSENTFYTNSGFSAYNGLLFTLSKNTSHGLQYDFNYTFSHSIDNTSFFANSMGDTGIGSGIGLICDVIRPRECRARSDFDARHQFNADAVYALPFGKGRAFAAGISTMANEFIGDWGLSGITSFSTGNPWTTASNAYVASYSNDAPAIYIGTDKSLIKNQVNKHAAGGGVTDFADSKTAAAQFEGPVGFQIGPRNQMTGPVYFNTDLGLSKNFPIYKEAVNLHFRADAFNALNHPNFNLPISNVYNGYDQLDYQRKAGFGKISSTVVPPGNENNGARVLQLSLRLVF